MSAVFLQSCYQSVTMDRAYFRIQGKHPIYSKRTSYFGNISWFDSSTTIKIQSISGNQFKQVPSLQASFMGYCSCLWFISSQRFWEFFLFLFWRKLQICHYQIVKSIKRILKFFFLATMVGQQKKKLSLEILKQLFHHSENISFCKKIRVQFDDSSFAFQHSNSSFYKPYFTRKCIFHKSHWETRTKDYSL